MCKKMRKKCTLEGTNYFFSIFQKEHYAFNNKYDKLLLSRSNTICYIVMKKKKQ